MTCARCKTQGNIADQLFCTSCNNRYHGACLESPVVPTSKVRAGWQCSECKLCLHCGCVIIVNVIYTTCSVIRMTHECSNVKCAIKHITRIAYNHPCRVCPKVDGSARLGVANNSVECELLHCRHCTD